MEPLLNYSSRADMSAASKVGAGVLPSVAYAAAHRHGHHVVGGMCRTIDSIWGICPRVAAT